MAPSTHDNYEEINYQLRKKFTKSLENAVKNHDKAVSLRLKTVWNPKDLKLFSYREKRFTQAGWTAFWESIDKSIQYFDSKLIPEITEEIERRNRFTFRREGSTENKPSTSFNYNRIGNNWSARGKLHHGQPATHRRSHDMFKYQRGGYRLPPPP